MKKLSLRAKMTAGSIFILTVPQIIIATVIFINSSRMLEDATRAQSMQLEVDPIC